MSEFIVAELRVSAYFGLNNHENQIMTIKLFSWNERRRIEWRSRPYFGGPVDGPYNGPPPGTWDIYQEKPPPFVETTYYHVVPHTEEVRNRDILSKNF